MARTPTFVAALVAIAISNPVPGIDAPSPLMKCGILREAEHSILRLRVHSAVLQSAAEHIGPFDRFVGNTGDLVSVLGDSYLERIDDLPSYDGWGRPIKVALCNYNSAVFSSGPDGILQSRPAVFDSICEGKWDYGRGENEKHQGDDIVIFAGRLYGNPLNVKRGEQKRTMSSIRTLGTALEAYQKEQEFPPHLFNKKVQSSSLVAILEPAYLRDGATPLNDAWGNPLVVILTEGESLILSFGCDGVPDIDYDEDPVDPLGLDSWIGPSGTTRFATEDIVYVFSIFYRWPDGLCTG